MSYFPVAHGTNLTLGLRILSDFLKAALGRFAAFTAKVYLIASTATRTKYKISFTLPTQRLRSNFILARSSNYQTLFSSLVVMTNRWRLRGGLGEGRKGVALLLDNKGSDEVKSRSFSDFHNKCCCWSGGVGGR